jgi:signal transduction histidine kinase
MSDNFHGEKLLIEETKAVKLFIWLFYIIFFTYEIFYNFIRPLSTGMEPSLPKEGLGIWLYIFLLGMLPAGIYLIKIRKPYLVKYLFFVVFLLLDFIHVLLKYYGQNKEFSDGNVIEIFLLLFATIFVNKRYVLLIYFGITIKYLLIGIILQDVEVFLPIGVFTFLLLFTLIILLRFLSYINALTSAYEEVRIKEKQALLGQMATSIGHEIRNPLAALRGFTQLQSERDTSNNHFYPIMLQEIDRIDMIVDDLMVLGKPKSINKTTNDIKGILNYVVLVTSQMGESYGVKIRFNQYGDLPEINCDEKQLKQVFINIIKNGIEAMKDGGFLELDCSMNGTDRIQVVIQDHGCGIDEEKLKLLGEPFFTTKQDGTGLGLMVSKKIIEDHQGEIQFESQIGVGTKITIHLPIKQ